MENIDKIEVMNKTRELGLPASWEDVCEMKEFPSIDSLDVMLGYYINAYHDPITASKYISEEDLESDLVFLKLHVLRNIYRKGWKPNWSDDSSKFVIEVDEDGSVRVHVNMHQRKFLSFPKIMTAVLFYENFNDLIYKAKDLI